jgi:enoyl-CoA hydratase
MIPATVETPTAAEGDYADVLFGVEHGIGWITLNRPAALNALNHEMVRRVTARLRGWAADDRVQAVVLTGAGTRGLCAGGDVRLFYRDARAGTRESVGFWRDEYALNGLIATYPKPYVAVMDGIVMGGGVGVSAHGGIRIVTERTALALPEVGIGFAPDVGGTWLLSRAPGEIGTHLALTGATIGPGDALVCDLADHYLPADRLPKLVARARAETLPDLLAELEEPGPPSPLRAARRWIDRCYAGDDVAEIVARLLAHPDPAARAAAATIATKSPTALVVSLRALRNARRLPLARVLEQDLRVSTAALTSADLAEGIRAQIIDKDRTPRWSPATLAEVDPAEIDRYFAPAP